VFDTTVPILDPLGSTTLQLHKLCRDLPHRSAPDLIPNGQLTLASFASRVAPAALAYARRCGKPACAEPLETTIRDLLADLMHLCDLFDAPLFAFDVLADEARAQHDAELAANPATVGNAAPRR
jgi:hypothetical protein